jgi:hypothetical protein
LYKNKKEETILMAFTTECLMTIDLAKKELKSNISYEDIKELIQTDSNKLKVSFRREINDVI